MDTLGTDGHLAYGVTDAPAHVRLVRLGRKKIVSRAALEQYLRENGQVTF